jgi:hypothetical protein
MTTGSGSNGFITREHPEYARTRQSRRMYRDLYEGGERFNSNASYYLVRRHKEPNDIYFERLLRVFYQNYAGSIIDWYTATLFRREPVLQFSGDNEDGKEFFNHFVQDCNRRGTKLFEFFRRAVSDALVYGKSYIAVDFPSSGGPAYSRAQEDEAGLSRAYLVNYSADEVINWSYDEFGVLDWIVIRTATVKQSSVRDESWKTHTRWIYYDRESFEVYASETAAAGGNGSPELVASGPHALSRQKKVPIFELSVTEGLWLMNKVSLLQLEHFNKSNALAWALTMGLFAVPVVYSDREFAQIMGESYFIQLGAQDKFGWTEPEGHVYQIAADNLVSLKDEIYRVCYMNSEISGGKGGANQSGLSKAWDFSVTEEILRSYGDVVKDSVQEVLTAISEARQDGIQIDVSGMDEFDIQSFADEVQDAASVLALQIPSETVKGQLYKRVALKYLSDARQNIKSQIVDEIDEALKKPIPAETN